jgi:hypothetical protein
METTPHHETAEPPEAVCPDEQLVRDWARIGLIRAHDRLAREREFQAYLDSTNRRSEDRP